jgi:hypothetical protein
MECKHARTKLMHVSEVGKINTQKFGHHRMLHLNSVVVCVFGIRWNKDHIYLGYGDIELKKIRRY